MSEATAVPIRPAATVVVMRAGEVLLLLRHGQHGFMPNMWVFPGGRVEVVDGEGDAGGRAAARRETAEEAGIALDGELAAIARWVTPLGERKRFDTRFYLAEVAVETIAVADASEVIEALWIAPGAALARHREGRLALAPPTFWVLEALRRLGDAAAIAAWAAAGGEGVIVEPKLTLEGGTAVVAVEAAALRLPPGPAVSGRLRLTKGVWVED